MLSKITAFAHEIFHSPDFTCIYEQGSPSDDSAVGYLKDSFKRLGHKVPNSLLEYYQKCNGFKLSWTYKKLTHPDYLTWGKTNIVELELLLSTIQFAPTEPILFDYISDINQVMLQMENKRIMLLYYDEYLQDDFPMSIEIDEYFYLLDESRGLYPWQELFIKSPSFQIKQVLKDKFFVDLNLLFSDVRPTIFGQDG